MDTVLKFKCVKLSSISRLHEMVSQCNPKNGPFGSTILDLKEKVFFKILSSVLNEDNCTYTVEIGVNWSVICNGMVGDHERGDTGLRVVFESFFHLDLFGKILQSVDESYVNNQPKNITVKANDESLLDRCQQWYLYQSAREEVDTMLSPLLGNKLSVDLKSKEGYIHLSEGSVITVDFVRNFLNPFRNKNSLSLVLDGLDEEISELLKKVHTFFICFPKPKFM